MKSIFQPGGRLLRTCCLLVGMVLSASCGEQTDIDQPVVADGEIVVVDREIKIAVMPMTAAGSPQTRGAAAQPRRFESVGVVYGDEAVTRAGEDPSVDESTIKSAYILQFDGADENENEGVSVLRTKMVLTSTQIVGTDPITCKFNMKAGVKNRVYVVANCDAVVSNLEVGTAQLKDLYASANLLTLPPSTSSPVSGFPMSAYQDVYAGDAFGVFTLKHRMAKIVARSNKAGAVLRLRNVSKRTSIGCGTDQSYLENGLTYAGGDLLVQDLTAGSPMYVCGNLGGRNQDLVEHSTRCAYFLRKQSSMLLQVGIGGGTSYDIYLGDGTPQDFNVESGHIYDVTANIYGTDPYDFRVNAGLTADKYVNLNKDGEFANCYVLQNYYGDWYQFDTTVMGNGATTLLPPYMFGGAVASAIVPTRLNPASVDVLWETKNTNVPLAAGDVIRLHQLRGKVLVSPVAIGNAVVAARDADGNIIWSWHTWIADEDPTSYTMQLEANDAVGMGDGEVIMMTASLGATAITDGMNNPECMGLFYQWGRKDPFPSGYVVRYDYSGQEADWVIEVDEMATTLGASGFGAESGVVPMATSIANPTTLYGTSLSDWTIRNDNLWGCPFNGSGVTGYRTYNSNRGSKTIYDPCPIGWRVPFAFVYDMIPGYSYEALGVEGYGYYFPLDTTAGTYAFPASGGLSNAGGKMTVNGVGYYGAYLTASSGIQGDKGLSYMSCLYLETDGVDPSRETWRSTAGSIRCIKR